MQKIRFCSKDQQNLSNIAGMKKTTEDMGEVTVCETHCIFNVGSIYNEHYWNLNYNLINATLIST